MGARPSPPHIIAILSEFTVSHQTIVVLDFGSQYTQLIARRLRELSVYSEVMPFNTPLEALRARQPAGIILSGGPKSVSEPDAPRCDAAVVDVGVPVLGICYGMQLLTDMLGGNVRRSGHREFGHAYVQVLDEPPAARLLAGLPTGFRVWASHGDDIAAVPPGFRLVATSDTAPIVGHGGARAATCMASCSIPRWCTPNTAPRSCGGSPSTSAAAPATGPSRPSSKKPRHGSGSRWASPARSCAGCRAASTRPWPRCSSIARLATG